MADIQPVSGVVSTASFFYKLDPLSGQLLYAYASPLVGSPGKSQLSEFNSFLGHENDTELYNILSEPVNV